MIPCLALQHATRGCPDTPENRAHERYPGRAARRSGHEGNASTEGLLERSLFMFAMFCRRPSIGPIRLRALSCAAPGFVHQLCDGTGAMLPIVGALSWRR